MLKEKKMNTPKELAEARKTGQTFYFTGKFCPKGHVAKRYTNSSKCVLCTSETSKKYGPQWYQNNKERLRPIRREHYKNNKNKYYDYQIKYREKNPEAYKSTCEKSITKLKNNGYYKKFNNIYRNRKNEIKRKRLKTDYEFRLRELVRSRIQSGLKKQITKAKKSMSSIKYLGCTYAKYINYLESKFTKEMNWENMGGNNGWQIDHIKPLTTFNLNTVEQQLIAFNYKNTQPLWKIDNLKKGANYNIRNF